MRFDSLIVGLIGSLLANLMFSITGIMKYTRGWRHRKILYLFWGNPKKIPNNAYIFYPSYPNPRVGRTQKQIGYYVSDEDAKAVDLLEHNLKEIGFDCERRVLTGSFDMNQPIPTDGIVVLVCGPKLDPNTNQVVYDPLIGGNPVSSWFYLRYHQSMGIELSYNKFEQRKQYKIQEHEVLYSPQDDHSGGNIDKGLLIRIKVNKQFCFLCWGIHGPATLGAVKTTLNPSLLSKLPLDSPDIIATIEANIDIRSGDITPEAVGYPLHVNIAKKTGTKPDPFHHNAYLEVEKPVYGFSYLWATNNNVTSIKSGDYSRILPVAAELDISLRCPYNCPWCPYREGRTKEVLDNDKTALEIIDKLATIGVRLAVFTGGGEPLESPCLEVMTESCRQRDILVTLYTNGFLLTHERSYRLMSSGISEIRVSLDDVSTNENYMKIHGLKQDRENAMERVKENVRRLLELRARNGFGTRIGASFLISDETLPHLRKSAKVLQDWVERVGPFDYMVIRPAVKYWHVGTEYYNTFFSGGEDSFDEVRKTACLFKISGVARHLIISRQRFMDLNKDVNKNTYKMCLASNLWLNIGPDGTAYLCCETKHREPFKIGNILKDPLESLLQNPIVLTRRSVPFGALGCPMLLCKPSAINILFDKIESERGVENNLPNETLEWLDAMAEHNKKTSISGILIPSVSGVYKEYSDIS